MAQRPCSQAIRSLRSQPRSTCTCQEDNSSPSPAPPGNLRLAKSICPGQLRQPPIATTAGTPPESPRPQIDGRDASGDPPRSILIAPGASPPAASSNFIYIPIGSKNRPKNFPPAANAFGSPGASQHRARTRHRDTKERWRAIIGHCAPPRCPPHGGGDGMSTRPLKKTPNPGNTCEHPARGRDTRRSYVQESPSADPAYHPHQEARPGRHPTRLRL